MNATIFHNIEHTNIIISESDITPEKCKNLKHIHTTITSQYLSSRKNNKVTNTTPYKIRTNITTLYAYKTGTTQANKSPLLQSYLHTVNPDMPQCPLCLSQTHETNHHLFNCSQELT